jgi:hypothetical protein
MSRNSEIKKLLSSSTTMPYGTGGGTSFLTGSHLRPSQAHGAGCSCCGPAEDGEEEEG